MKSGPPFFDEQRLRAVLPMDAAIEALRIGFGRDLPKTPARAHHETHAATLLVMPAWDEASLGVKLVTVASGNPDRGLPLIHGIYILFDGPTAAPTCLFDGSALTGLRTAAVSGLVTDLLARKAASRLLIFGAGTQARWHVEAMRSVREIAEVIVVARRTESARSLVEDLGAPARVGSPSDVASADIICTCTTSSVPLFDGDQLPEGCHVNAVGAFRPHERELDTTSVVRGRVVVESREAALSEAGELAIPISEGAITPNVIVSDIPELVAGTTVRRSDGDITVFKSVGAAYEDLIIAAEAAERAGVARPI